MKYDVMFPSFFVNSLILGFFEDVFLCAIYSVAFSRGCISLSRVCSSVSVFPFACVTKKCSSSATSEEEVVTSKGVVCMSSQILRQNLSVTFNSNLERKPSAALTEPAICAISKMNCST